MKDIIEIAGTTITLLLFALLVWLYLMATPDQSSAECDLAAEAAR